MKVIKIRRLRYGWYNFEKIPQESYMQVHNLNCGDDETALKQARKINPNFNYKIVGEYLYED